MDNDKIHWFFALVATVLFIGLNGYSFNYVDQEEHLPQVYKLFNPSLYPNDYFMVPNERLLIRFIINQLGMVCPCSQVWKQLVSC